MTVSTHIYEAELIGSPDLPLKVKGGSVTLDVTRSPHVTASLTISTPALSTLNALDPRNTERVRISVAATFPTMSQSRTFDLAIRDRQVSQADAEVTLTLASDESLLLDYAPLADDITPRSTESSLRSIINYVLNKAIPGAALEASPAHNHNSTRYWPVTNLIPNPTAELDALNWAPGSNATSVSRYLMTVPPARTGSYAIGFDAIGAGDANLIPTAGSSDTTTYRVVPGTWYVWSFWIESDTVRGARAAIQWWSNDGTVLSATSFGAQSNTAIGTWTRRTIIAQAPKGATSMFPYVNTRSNTGGETHYVEDAMLYEGDELVDAFSGATADSSTYVYDWSATAHASTSTRTPVNEVTKDSLTWKAGQSALDFLLPLVQVAGLRLVCNEARDWTLRDENYVAPGELDVIYGVNMIAGSDSISLDDEAWHDAAVVRHTWTDTEGAEHVMVDSFALSTPYVKLRLFDRDTPYPGPGFAEYSVRRAQQRGREVSVTAVSDWRAQPEQESQFVLQGAAIQTGRADSITFNLDDDTMTVVSRTTDTGAGAIDLLSGTINGLTGTINGL